MKETVTVFEIIEIYDVRIRIVSSLSASAGP
jgi:hypothetical protein